jgi:hypothetical protein
MVEKQWLVTLRWTVAFGQQRTEELDRLRPQWTEPLFASFPKEAKVWRRRETEVRDTKCDDLLDARAGICAGYGI